MKCVCAEHGRPWRFEVGEEVIIEICDFYVGGEEDDDTCMECAHVKACHKPEEKSDAIRHRLQEMEYAVDSGNSAREDVPADTLRNWFRYVWTGEEMQ